MNSNDKQTLSESSKEPLPVPASLWHLFVEAVARNPNSSALTVLYQSPDTLKSLLNHPPRQDKGCLSWTFSEMQAAVLRVAAALLAQGAKRGSTLITLLTNGVEREVLLWASAALQMTHIPLDASLAEPGRKEELKHYLSLAKAHGVVAVESEQSSTTIDGIIDDIPGTVYLTTTGAARQGRWQTIESVAGGVSGKSLQITDFTADEAIEQNGNRVALILHTSGTSTGRPKGCPLSVTWALSTTVHLDAMFREATSWVFSTANFRVIANSVVLFCAYAGSEVIMPSATFQADRILHAVEKYHGEGILAVPFHLKLLCVEATAKKYALDSLKNISFGGDVVTTDAVDAAEKCFPSAKVFPVHGMTEAVGLMGYVGKARDLPLPRLGNIVSVGRANYGARIRVVNSAKQTVPRGEVGQLVLSGPSVIQQYCNNVQPDTFLHDHDRGVVWLLTGDQAIMDESANVFVLGREKDIIKRKAITLSPTMIISTLNREAGIEVTAFGVPHSLYGEAPVVVLHNRSHQADAQHIKDIVLRSLGAEYAIEHVFRLIDLGLDDFPLNKTGKIMNRELRDLVIARLKQNV